MERARVATRIVGLALGFAIAVAALASASAQQEPPYRFYGTGATAGDEIAVMDAEGEELGTTTVDSDGNWYIDVAREMAEGAMFTLNGESAKATISEKGSGQAEVMLTVAMAEDHDETMTDDSTDDDSLMSDDTMEDDGEPSMSGDAMDEEHDVDDGMGMGDGHADTTMNGHGYPETGSGGLVSGSGASVGLIGLLVALGAIAITGLALRRARNRA